MVPPTVAQALPNQTLNKKMLPQTCPQPTWSKHFLSVGSSSQLTLVGVKPMKPISTDYLSNVPELEVRKWRRLSGTHTVYTIWQLSAVPRIYTIRMKLKFFQHTPANISSTFCPPAFLNSLTERAQTEPCAQEWFNNPISKHTISHVFDAITQVLSCSCF